MAPKSRPPEDRRPKFTSVVQTPTGARYDLMIRLPSGAKGLLVIRTFDAIDEPTVAIWEIAQSET